MNGFMGGVYPGYLDLLTLNLSPETPETAIARACPEMAIGLLDREGKRRHYSGMAGIGARVTEIYIRGLEPQELARIRSIRIDPERRRNIFGLPIGGKGLVISFEGE